MSNIDPEIINILCGQEQPRKLYIVFQEAVYRHECGGVFSTIEKAIEAANLLAEADIDSHHSYDVQEFTLDLVTEFTTKDQWNTDTFDIIEPKVLYSVNKDKVLLPFTPTGT